MPAWASDFAGAEFLTEISNGYRFGMFLRGRTAELNRNDTADPVWGGFVISRSI